MTEKDNWEGVYKKEFNGTWYPAENIVKFSARYLRRRVGINNWEVKNIEGKVEIEGKYFPIAPELIFYKWER